MNDITNSFRFKWLNFKKLAWQIVAIMEYDNIFQKRDVFPVPGIILVHPFGVLTTGLVVPFSLRASAQVQYASLD